MAISTAVEMATRQTVEMVVGQAAQCCDIGLNAETVKWLHIQLWAGQADRPLYNHRNLQTAISFIQPADNHLTLPTDDQINKPSNGYTIKLWDK